MLRRVPPATALTHWVRESVRGSPEDDTVCRMQNPPEAEGLEIVMGRRKKDKMELVPERPPGVLSVTRTGGGPWGAGAYQKTGPKKALIKSNQKVLLTWTTPRINLEVPLRAGQPGNEVPHEHQYRFQHRSERPTRQVGEIAEPQTHHFAHQAAGRVGSGGREGNRQCGHRGRQPLRVYGRRGSGPATTPASAADSPRNGPRRGSRGGVAQPRGLGCRIRIAEARRHILESVVTALRSTPLGVPSRLHPR